MFPNITEINPILELFKSQKISLSLFAIMFVFFLIFAQVWLYIFDKDFKIKRGWVGKVDAVLPDGETCKAVKFSRSEGWGVKATTTEMLFVPQDEPNLSFEENYFDVYKTGFEGSDSLYKTIDFVSTSKLEEYLKENLNNMAEFFDAISKK